MAEGNAQVLSDAFTKARNGMLEKTVLALKSGGMGFLFPAFSAKIPAAAVGHDLYVIEKQDWDSSIGPIFDRLLKSIGNKDRSTPEYNPIATGYTAVTGEANRQLHKLIQAFSAAAEPAQLKTYTGTPETNDHLAWLTAFVDVNKNRDGAVMINGLQLQAIADMACKAIEHAREGDRITDTAKAFYRDFLRRDGVGYAQGLINALT